MVGRTRVGDFCYIPVMVEGVSSSALVDTGSTATLVRPDILSSWTNVQPTTVQLRTVTGERAPMVGKGQLKVTVGERTVTHDVWVADVEDPCILGLDILKALGCVIDLGKDTASFPGGQTIYMTPRPGPQTLPTTRTVASVETSDPALTDHHDTQTPDQRPDPSPPPGSPPTPPPPGNNGVPPEEEEVVIAAVRDIWQLNCGGLDPRESEQLWDVLFEFRASFSLREDDVGQTHLVQHDIDTGDARPVRMRPRRLPLARQQAADKALWEMQQAGIIEPSTSAWAAPVVMVPKQQPEKWRFCVDYRPLNTVTKKDSYPLPRIDETLDAVAGSSWFSSLDLRSGYWQVALTAEAREKTAFITNQGLWQFKVLPFGLCNAPATFERLMDSVLAGIPRQECVVYLDDILAHGGSFQVALGALRRVLERVAAAGLKLHPRKCRFLQREVTFLGHKLGREGISTVEDKVQAVRDWPTPTDTRQLKGFLGLASYYRKFVKGFSCVAAPLFTLLQKDREFVWTEACQAAFGALQEALTQAPALSPPDTSLPFILDTDASNVGAGAVLAQVGPEGERVVAYYSRTFNKAERRYCVTRRELLAVVSAVRHFKYYLCGLTFTVRTDHSALQWLMSFKEPEGQVARWIEELQSYNFAIVHRAGARHTNADALSRRPCSESGCRHCEKREDRERELCTQEESCAALTVAQPAAGSELRGVDAGEWRQRQEEDMDLKPALRWVEGGRKPPWGEVAVLSQATKGLWAKYEPLRLCDGVLQRGWKEPATGEVRWQVVVPRHLREAVLQAVHGAPGTGHFGVTKTLRRLRQSFYWGQHKRDVEDFCRRCDSCTARKGPPERSHAPLQQFPVGSPMERVGVDVMGPFPRSDKGNRYVLTVMDYFTKWPEAYAVPDQEAETVVDALVEGMFSRFGAPESIHSDQGRNFESRVFAAMCDKLGIHKTRTTPLHPQSDGLVERFNKTLAEQLAIVTAKHQRDWDMQLPLVLMACRSAVQESTACTPALLMLGREIRTPAELAFGRPPDSPPGPPGLEYARKLQDRLETAHNFARKQLLCAGVRQKRNYDVRARGRDFQAGELVWVYSPQRKKGRCPKLDCQWIGPCRVLEKIGEVVYRVQLPPRGRRVAIHRDRLCPYHGNATPPQIPVNPNIAAPQGAQSQSPGPSYPPSPNPPHQTPVRPSRPNRQRRPPGRFRDFVVP